MQHKEKLKIHYLMYIEIINQNKLTLTSNKMSLTSQCFVNFNYTSRTPHSVGDSKQHDIIHPTANQRKV